MFKKYTPQLDVRVAEDKESVSLSTAQKVRFLLRISLVNVNKSTVSCGKNSR